ncbi:Helicase [Aphelenchoides besseyi]|nr:Helicase [Aphelenchoides besseyi]
MEEADDYVPQISQIDYNGSTSAGNGAYYDPSMSNMYGGTDAAAQQHHFARHQQMLPNSSQMMPHGYAPNPQTNMMAGHPMASMGQQMMSAQQAPQSTSAAPAAKPKRGGRQKKNAATQPSSETTPTPTQQPLPPSYPPNQMNPALMRQQQNPYAAYPMQQGPGQGYYNMQQQYRAQVPQPYMQQNYPMQQGPGQGYYNMQQQYRPPVPQPYMQQNYPMQQTPGQGYGQQRPPFYPQNQLQAGYPQYPNQNQPPTHGQKPNMNSGEPSFPHPSHLMHSGAPPNASGHPYYLQVPTHHQHPATSTASQSIPTSSGKEDEEARRRLQQPSLPPNVHHVSPGYLQQPQPGMHSSMHPTHSNIPGQSPPQMMLPPGMGMQSHPMNVQQQYADGWGQRQKQMMQQPGQVPTPNTSQKPTPSSKPYTPYQSNGQLAETSNTQSMPTISAASTAHIPSEQSALRRQDSNSAVSVMQTAASKVQVNITPEAPGRTLISVYQYTTGDVMTTSHNAMATTSTTQSGKDSIPPEPVPSSLPDNDSLYGRHSQYPVAGVPSTSALNSPSTTELKPKDSAVGLSSEYTNYANKSDYSPIPPQPIPSTYGDINQRTEETPLSSASVLVSEQPSRVADSILAVNAEPFAEEHAIEKVENLQTGNSQLSPNQLESNIDEQSDEQSNEVKAEESFDADIDDLKPPAAPRAVATFDEDEEDEKEMEISYSQSIPDQTETISEEKQSIDAENTIVSKPSSFVDQSNLQEQLEQNGYPMIPNETNVPIVSMPIESQPLESTSISQVQPEIDQAIGIQEAATENEMDPAYELPLALTPTAKKKTTLKVKVPKSKGKKNPASAQSRKRKKTTSEDELTDEDLEFVPELKKKKGKSKVPPIIEAAETTEPKLEDFVEKRRSERNRTERKTYNEKMDIDEELEELAPRSPTADSSPRELMHVPELIVEKILGVRVVTKMVPKQVVVEEERKATNGVEEIPNDEEQKTEETTAEEPKEEVQKENEPTEPAEPVEEETSVATVVESKSKEPEKEVEMEEAQVEEIYVKFKGLSYLHCEWKSVEELEALDKRIVGKINRFKQKYGEAYLDDSEYFNEDYTIVDRVIDEHQDEETGEHIAFIKWRSLQYEECTWENIDIVPKSKLEEFHRRNDKIDPYKAKERLRPTMDEWQKIPKDKKYKDENMLREYQFEGVNWLLFCYFNKRNCILADEMGLGKTIQTITFLQGVHDLGIHGPFLIVVPLSTLHNWEREFETWTDMNAVVYHGSAASRDIIQQYEMYYKTEPKKKNIVKFDALLTTYEMIVSDCEFLRRFNYRVCVIDEAHRLKNRHSKLLTGGLYSFKMEHRVLLTGTPIQNNIQELFSLLNFLEPEQFGSPESFIQQFGECQSEDQVQRLQEILKPMMLRRLKEDVEKTLKPKEETIIEVQLSNIQKKYYRAIMERNFSHLLKSTNQPSLMNVLMELRKCCNHPFLLKGAEEQIVSELRSTHPEKNEEEFQLFSLIESSGKFSLLDKLLPKLQKDGHKVLIFSQMVKVLDILEEYLSYKNYTYERLDGNIRGDLRQAAIDRFSRPDSDRFVFLLATRAGGLGINLTAADTVIIYDSDFNPQSDSQAQARCHRIGQKKMVKVYRLITTNTYEREMFDKASLKLGLDRAVLQSMNPKDNQQMTKKEVEDLLKKGAYGAVMDEDNEGSKFSEEDIDTILQRRTQTIRLEPGVKGSTFAKASFTSTSNREDIDIDDPNFWDKWAKKANVVLETGENNLIVSEPRSRRKRFEENYKGLNEGGSEEGEDTDEDSVEPATSKNRSGRGSLEFSKSRSGKKRRRADEDDDYVNYTPDELTFNKSEYFKVEKLLSSWGWGRWKAIKEHCETTLNENDIEHISRTLLLHCIREYRGDEKCREFVWQLIIPENGAIGKGGKKGVIGGGLYHEGWAALPEYNPPAFAVDSSFQRHVHRHANKLLQRMFQLFVLQAHLISNNVKDSALLEKSHKDIELDVPSAGDQPLPNWDLECDKSYLIGIYKHGMENFEAMRTDPKLCFIDKNIDEMPTTLEMNTRFKRIVVLLSKKLEAAVSHAQNSARWPREEEAEFMRLLRIYGVKDDHEGHNVINWNRFRELSTNLQRKTDAEMLEELYCVLAMCTKQQGGELSEVDRRRAAMVDPIPTIQAERLMFRLHLMRKIHAIITTGIQNVRTSLKLCSADTMYSGWGELQDEQLMMVVDSHGIDNVTQKVSGLPAFAKFAGAMEEAALLRRVMEICTTLETGRWNGRASIAMLDDDGTLEGGSNQSLAALQKPMATSQNLNTSTSSRLSNQQQKRGRKKMSTSTLPTASVSSSSSTQNAQLAAAQALMEVAMSNPSYLLPLLNSQAAGSSSTSQQQQQQQQMQAMLAMCALSSMMPGTSGNANSAANKQAMMALSAMMGEDPLNLSMAAFTPYGALLGNTSSGLSSGLPSTTTGIDANTAALAALLSAQLPTSVSTPQSTQSTKTSTSKTSTANTASSSNTATALLSAQMPPPVSTPQLTQNAKTSTSSTSKTSTANPGSSSNTAAALLAAQLQPSVSTPQPTQNAKTSTCLSKTSTTNAVSSSNTAGMDANTAALAALISAQLPSSLSTPQSSQNTKTSTSSSRTSTANASSSSNNAAATLAMTEAAMTVELLSNPALALLLSGGALTNNNSSVNNLSSAFPFPMDLNTALQLNALSGVASLASMASPLQGTTTSSASTSTPSNISAPAKKTTSSASTSRASKLNAVLEKLSSSSQNATNNS